MIILTAYTLLSLHAYFASALKVGPYNFSVDCTADWSKCIKLVENFAATGSPSDELTIDNLPTGDSKLVPINNYSKAVGLEIAMGIINAVPHDRDADYDPWNKFISRTTKAKTAEDKSTGNEEAYNRAHAYLQKNSESVEASNVRKLISNVIFPVVRARMSKTKDDAEAGIKLLALMGFILPLYQVDLHSKRPLFYTLFYESARQALTREKEPVNPDPQFVAALQTVESEKVTLAEEELEAFATKCLQTRIHALKADMIEEADAIALLASEDARLLAQQTVQEFVEKVTKDKQLSKTFSSLFDQIENWQIGAKDGVPGEAGAEKKATPEQPNHGKVPWILISIAAVIVLAIALVSCVLAC